MSSFTFVNISILFCDGITRKGKLVPSVPCFYPSIALFFILSFLYLPVRPIGCNLKNPGVAHEAQLLITVGHGRV